MEDQYFLPKYWRVVFGLAYVVILFATAGYLCYDAPNIWDNNGLEARPIVAWVGSGMVELFRISAETITLTYWSQLKEYGKRVSVFAASITAAAILLSSSMMYAEISGGNIIQAIKLGSIQVVPLTISIVIELFCAIALILSNAKKPPKVLAELTREKALNEMRTQYLELNEYNGTKS